MQDPFLAGETKQLRLSVSVYFKLLFRFVSQCTVLDVKSGKSYLFVCNSWIGLGIGDGVLFKSFAEATKEESQDLEYLFFSNAAM